MTANVCTQVHYNKDQARYIAAERSRSKNDTKLLKEKKKCLRMLQPLEDDNAHMLSGCYFSSTAQA